MSGAGQASGAGAAPNEQPLTVAEASAAILREVSPLPHVDLPLRDSLGLVLAEDVRSPLALPPWDNASMDGYAVQGADVRGASRSSPRTLRVVGLVPAGSASSRTLGEGEAIRIMTGAPVPEGADSVIRVEDTDAGESTVQIFADRDVARNIRPRGEDLALDALALPAGTPLGPAQLGLLASVGRATVRVHRRPRVAVLASGDELVEVDRFADVIAGSRIVSSNSYTLETAVAQAGGEPIPLGVVGDDPVALRGRLASMPCDLLLTTGGVSVGAHDYTRSALAELGMNLRFWRVRIRPGAPVGFGVLNGTPWLGLPGNPVSTLVTFELFARPAIRRMLGHRSLFRRAVTVVAGEPMAITAPLTHYLRVVLRPADSGEWIATLTGPQGSGLLSSMARADALVVIPAERARVEAGERLTALLLRDDILHSDVLDTP